MIKIPLKQIHSCDQYCARTWIPESTNKFRLGPNESYKNGQCDEYGQIQPAWVYIAKMNMDNILNIDDVVITDTKIKIPFDYPLNGTHIFEFESTNGFTRRNIMTHICQTYADIYKKEEETSVKETDSTTGCLNRSETSGVYGIWGHDIGDLAIERLSYDPQTQTIKMFIGS